MCRLAFCLNGIRAGPPSSSPFPCAPAPALCSLLGQKSLTLLQLRPRTARDSPCFTLLERPKGRRCVPQMRLPLSQAHLKQRGSWGQQMCRSSSDPTGDTTPRPVAGGSLDPQGHQHQLRRAQGVHAGSQLLRAPNGHPGNHRLTMGSLPNPAGGTQAPS